MWIKKYQKSYTFFPKKFKKWDFSEGHLVSEYIYEQVLVNTSDSYVSLS